MSSHCFGVAEVRSCVIGRSLYYCCEVIIYIVDLCVCIHTFFFLFAYIYISNIYILLSFFYSAFVNSFYLNLQVLFCFLFSPIFNLDGRSEQTNGCVVACWVKS